MEITKELLENILDAYAYEVVFVDRDHIVRYMNKTAKIRYQGRVEINQSLFNCHNENSKGKIEEFLKRADAGERQVIGYFERHEMPWDDEHPEIPVTKYWEHRR